MGMIAPSSPKISLGRARFHGQASASWLPRFMPTPVGCQTFNAKMVNITWRDAMWGRGCWGRMVGWWMVDDGWWLVHGWCMDGWWLMDGGSIWIFMKFHFFIEFNNEILLEYHQPKWSNKHWGWTEGYGRLHNALWRATLQTTNIKLTHVFFWPVRSCRNFKFPSFNTTNYLGLRYLVAPSTS